MNTINAEQRLRVAAADKAEAAKIKVGCLVSCQKAHNLRQSHNAALPQDAELSATSGCPWSHQIEIVRRFSSGTCRTPDFTTCLGQGFA